MVTFGRGTMGDNMEQLKLDLEESQASQVRLLKRISELEKQLQNLEFHHRTTHQLLLSIIDMDAASGGDRSSLRRRIKILSSLDDHFYDKDEGLSELGLHDILQSFITTPQEFGLPPAGIQVTTFFDRPEESTLRHSLDTQTALVVAICITDILAGLFTISDTISLQAHHLKDKDIIRFRCQTGTNSRMAEEILNQIYQGSFFSLLEGKTQLSFLPPNPKDGPGAELDIIVDTP